MKKIFLLSFWLLISACVSKTHNETAIPVIEKPKRIEKTVNEPSKRTSIVVDSKDLEILEKMNKAVELYVLKNERTSFTALCKDIRFDCFVDEKPFPVRKKKIARSIPPYASGSKMGLQREIRVHVKYDFFP